jgi:membrane fusion protein (multidrug efflux system)
MKPTFEFVSVALAAAVGLTVPITAQAPTPVEVATVAARQADRRVILPGEFQPYLAVPIFARVSGFVKSVDVDRGSSVKRGQLLATLEAPEVLAQIVEAQSRAQVVEIQRTEAEARLAGAQSTYDRLKAASATPGVVAENDVVVAQKNAEAAAAMVQATQGSIKAAQAHVQAVRELEQYLQIRAPFDGVITERNVHPGALVGPNGSSLPLMRLHQLSRLRLVVAVPEALVGAIVTDVPINFTVPAYPGEAFSATVSRRAHDLDARTRSMAVELDVRNPDLKLSAGMYPEVQWPIRRPQPSLLVPPTAVVTTTERTFVIRVSNGTAEWVNVSRGARVGDLIEVFGALIEGDIVVRRATDEIRAGTKVAIQAPKAG